RQKLSRSASKFSQQDLDALQVRYEPVEEFEVIPNVKVFASIWETVSRKIYIIGPLSKGIRYFCSPEESGLSFLDERHEDPLGTFLDNLSP
ncbi:15636_t:CDS:2, partial [Funneliformis geosporum]